MAAHSRRVNKSRRMLLACSSLDYSLVIYERSGLNRTNMATVVFSAVVFNYEISQLYHLNSTSSVVRPSAPLLNIGTCNIYPSFVICSMLCTQLTELSIYFLLTEIMKPPSWIKFVINICHTNSIQVLELRRIFLDFACVLQIIFWKFMNKSRTGSGTPFQRQEPLRTKQTQVKSNASRGYAMASSNRR